EEENASGPMAQVIGRMEAIAADTGCSIVFLHHASKGAPIMAAPLLAWCRNTIEHPVSAAMASMRPITCA
ncbi:helicase RepA family protein, partial [Aeromonas caviae]|uniref:helicase RepA family protein n=1 Tax=Aeromonas caviae TaxID=648 RepID=UPI001CC71FD7